jgi:hypothetical protein
MSTDYTDLIARLRGLTKEWALGLEAADTIEMLQHELNFFRTERDELCGRFTEIAPCDPGDIPKLIAARACAAHRAAVARIAELEAFIAGYCICPCCTQTLACSEDCTFASDDPVSAEHMAEARSALREPK